MVNKNVNDRPPDQDFDRLSKASTQVYMNINNVIYGLHSRPCEEWQCPYLTAAIKSARRSVAKLDAELLRLLGTVKNEQDKNKAK